MLEFWYKERRTLVDFRRGPLGPYFDGFAEYLKQRGYCYYSGKSILGKCCAFNIYLIEKGITNSKRITPLLIEPFLETHFVNFRTKNLSYCPRLKTRNILKMLFSYLTSIGVIKQMKPKVKPTLYSWVLEPYLKHMKNECELSETTIQRNRDQLTPFLEGLGEKVIRKNMKTLKPEPIEAYIQQHIKNSPENLLRLVASLRSFLRFCAQKGYMNRDFSSLVPSIPSYRYASLPKGMEESDLQRMLKVVDKNTPTGARDYAIMLVMMAYGIRGKQAAALLLEDICWQQSTIRIRPLKGGKEVLLPLLEGVGEAIIKYLRYRPENQFRQVFITVHAPLQPLTSNAVSRIIRKYMIKAGVKKLHGGSNTLRHSWAIRALTHNTPIKAISDVLGHRCINTTFIYAKADLNTLRQVAMPWPEGR